MHETVRIAAAQYPLHRPRSWDAYRAKLARWVAKASHEKAKIIVFPEYGSMELVPLSDRRAIADRRSPTRHTEGPLLAQTTDRRASDRPDWEIDAIQPLIEKFLALHAELAKQYQVYILAGSLPVRCTGGVRNTAYLFSPDGMMGSQEKIVLTRWEREIWGMTGGDSVKVFETRYGAIGIAICYDVEFPLIARSQAEAKARIILAPCCTSSLRGYHRVRVGARARALENQAYVIQAPIIGTAPWSVSTDFNVGSAGVYAPPDLGPRENGVVAQGRCNIARWVFADLDLAAVDRIRSNGVIANSDEWMSHLGVGPALKGQFEPVVDRLVPAARR